MAKSVRRSVSTKVPVRGRASNIPGRNMKVNPAASSKRPRKREKRKPSPAYMDEGHGSCLELGAAVKNPPA
jgi:hypothetical protein